MFVYVLPRTRPWFYLVKNLHFYGYNSDEIKCHLERKTLKVTIKILKRLYWLLIYLPDSFVTILLESSLFTVNTGATRGTFLTFKKKSMNNKPKLHYLKKMTS